MEKMHMYEYLKNLYEGPKYESLQFSEGAARRIYHGWCGFSNKYHTTDGKWYACDWYAQAPDEVYTGKYQWYVLPKVNEPSLWYQATEQHHKGSRGMELVRGRPVEPIKSRL